MKRILLTILLLTLFAACDNDRKENEPETVYWKTYTLDNSALINNFVNCVAVDSDDHIWAGNYYGDMTEFDGAEWTHHMITEPAPYNSTVNKLAVDNQNAVWAMSDNSLFHLNNGVWTQVTNASFNFLSDFSIASDNSVFAVRNTYGNNFWHYASGSWTNLDNSYLLQNLRKLAVTIDGRVWIGGYNQLSYYSSGTIVSYTTANSGLPGRDIISITVDGVNKVWVGTSTSGLASFDQYSWTTFNTGNSGLPSNQVQVIAFDRYNHLWVGTDHGVAFYDNNQWTVYNTENSGLLSNYITGIALDSKNNVWIATFGGGLSAFNENGIK